MQRLTLATCPLSNRLDGLVYCPGTIHLKRSGRQARGSRDFKVNAMGLLQTVQANLKLLKAAAADPIGGQPSIVGFSTVAVQTGMGFHASIAMAKGALEGLVGPWRVSLRRTSGPTPSPSLTDTPLAAALLSSEAKREASAERHPLKRVSTADDVAAMAAFLLSPDAAPSPGRFWSTIA